MEEKWKMESRSPFPFRLCALIIMTHVPLYTLLVIRYTCAWLFSLLVVIVDVVIVVVVVVVVVVAPSRLLAQTHTGSTCLASAVRSTKPGGMD